MSDDIRCETSIIVMVQMTQMMKKGSNVIHRGGMERPLMKQEDLERACMGVGLPKDSRAKFEFVS
jgi:hypothetical protein